jgi:hypothetical protein
MPLRLRVIPSGKSKGRVRKAAPDERAIEFDDGVGQIRIGRRADLELSPPVRRATAARNMTAAGCSRISAAQTARSSAASG